MKQSHGTNQLVPAVLELLRRLRRKATTEEGERDIIQHFNRKIARVGGVHVFLEKLQVMYHYFVDPLPSKKKKALIGAALLYFITPMDVIPDIIPGLGWIDDGVAALFVWNLLKNELERYEQKRQLQAAKYEVSETENIG